MPMQDTINEIYRMRQEAYDRERQEREAEIVRLEAVKKKQAEQWVRMLLCVISTLTLSTTGAQQKVDPKNDSVKPIL